MAGVVKSITCANGLVTAASGGTALVADGGTGNTTFTAYSVVCGGTTTTAALQSVASVGTSGQVLTSNGAGALPTFQAGASLPNVGTAGTGGRGSVFGSALEQSNVDIAQEFTQMILAQRGYQANSRSITVADELLVETLNLKR